MKERHSKNLDTTLTIKVEASVAKDLQLMSDHTKIPLDQMINVALQRYISTHSDYFPPKKKGA